MTRTAAVLRIIPVVLGLELPGTVAAVQTAVDIAGEYDLSGHGGIALTSWADQGMSYGFIFPVEKPGAEKVDFHSATAENVMHSTFLGHTRERLIGIHGGVSRYLGYSEFTAYVGAGILYGRRYRLYEDENRPEGHLRYYVADRVKKRLLLDIEAALCYRGPEFIVGLGLRLATRGIFIRLGIPAGG